MHIEGLIFFKSSIDQAIASLYFLRISNNFCSSSSVNDAEIMTGFAFLVARRHTSNVQAILLESNPLSLCLLQQHSLHNCWIFFVLFSSILITASFYLKLEFRNSTSRRSRYWKFISFSFNEL